jgi:hypothetical protein
MCPVVEVADVDREVADRLGAVDQDARVVAVGERRHLLDGRHGSEHVRGMAEGDELRPRAEQVLERRHVDPAALVERDDFEIRPLVVGEQLPGHDVRVVLERRQDDLVARADVRPPPALRDEVDRLGRAAHEDDLVRARRSEEARDGGASLLVALGRAAGHRVGAAVHVGVVRRVELAHRLDDLLGLLRRGRVVEPDQRAPVDLAMQDREVPADRLDSERRLLTRRLGLHRLLGLHRRVGEPVPLLTAESGLSHNRGTWRRPRSRAPRSRR